MGSGAHGSELEPDSSGLPARVDRPAVGRRVGAREKRRRPFQRPSRPGLSHDLGAQATSEKHAQARSKSCPISQVGVPPEARRHEDLEIHWQVRERVDEDQALDAPPDALGREQAEQRPAAIPDERQGLGPEPRNRRPNLVESAPRGPTAAAAAAQ